MTEEFSYPLGMFRYKLSDIADIEVTATKVVITHQDNSTFTLKPHPSNRVRLIGQASIIETNWHARQDREDEQ